MIIKVLSLMRRGVMFEKPFSTKIKGNLKIGKDVQIGANVIFDGDVELSDGVLIEDNCRVSNAKILDHVHLKSNTFIEDSIIGSGSFAGPFARVRGNTVMGNDCQIGNFVEIKSSSIGQFCRVNHMAFIGDSILEDGVTIGAGVITCNHDGKNINETHIKKEAYIGSNSNLIAPVVIGKKSTIGSGSTISKDVADNKLVIARSHQIEVPGWKRPSFKRNEK